MEKGLRNLSRRSCKIIKAEIPVEQAFDYYQVNKKRRIAILAATKKKAGKGEHLLPEEGKQNLSGKDLQKLSLLQNRKDQRQE